MQYGAVARCVVYCIDDFGVCGMDDFGVRASLCVLLCIAWGCIEGGGPATVSLFECLAIPRDERHVGVGGVLGAILLELGHPLGPDDLL